MTQVNGTDAKLKVISPQQENTTVAKGSNVDTQLSNALSTKEIEEKPLNTPLRAQDLDFSKLPKGNRLDASEFANRSLNEVKDLAREFNADFPDSPYIVDYSSFPKPEDFDKNNYGGKKEAYAAWKNSVTEWVEDCKQDMIASKSKHLGSLAENFEKTMNSGFFGIYLQMGITREEIKTAFEALEGDINGVKKYLDKKADEIKANTRNIGAQVTKNVNKNTDEQASGVHAHIDHNTGAIMDKVDSAQIEITRNIETEEQKTRDTVSTEHKQTRAKAEKLKDEIMKKLEEMPTKKSLVYDYLKGVLKSPVDVAKAGFDLGSCLLGLHYGALQKLQELLS